MRATAGAGGGYSSSDSESESEAVLDPCQLVPDTDPDKNRSAMPVLSQDDEILLSMAEETEEQLSAAMPCTHPLTGSPLLYMWPPIVSSHCSAPVEPAEKTPDLDTAPGSETKETNAGASHGSAYAGSGNSGSMPGPGDPSSAASADDDPILDPILESMLDRARLRPESGLLMRGTGAVSSGILRRATADKHHPTPKPSGI